MADFSEAQIEQPVQGLNKVALYTPDGRRVIQDSNTGGQPTLTYGHHKIHEGEAYVISEVYNLDTDTAYWMITTPDSLVYSHVVFDVRCTGEFYMKVTEGADRTGTTLLTAINRNRNSDNEATLTMHRGYSDGSTDGATTILEIRDGSTNVAGKVIMTGGLRGQNEFMLKANTKYIIAVTTYSDVYISGQLDWYEQQNKD